MQIWRAFSTTHGDRHAGTVSVKAERPTPWLFSLSRSRLCLSLFFFNHFLPLSFISCLTQAACTTHGCAFLHPKNGGAAHQAAAPGFWEFDDNGVWQSYEKNDSVKLDQAMVRSYIYILQPDSYKYMCNLCRLCVLASHLKFAPCTYCTFLNVKIYVYFFNHFFPFFILKNKRTAAIRRAPLALTSWTSGTKRRQTREPTFNGTFAATMVGLVAAAAVAAGTQQQQQQQEPQ